MKFCLKSTVSVAVAVSAALLSFGLSAAETRVEVDYVAVIIEAEDTVQGHERWVLTTPSTGEQEDDPDGNHSSGASGNAYLELLPDLRTNRDEVPPSGSPGWLWGQPGDGPTATYTADFPEAGRYYTHVRAFSTGSEDNGIHVGLNGIWQSSGASLQLCTAGANDWRWSNKKRGSGGQDCGIKNSIWLDVADAGTHTVMISAREDGFEIDKLMLIKDRSGNTRNCSPQFDQADRINCSDGGIEAIDELVDLVVELETSIDEGEIGDLVELTAIVKNLDTFDRANGTVVEFSLDENDWELVESDERCDDLVDGKLRCVLGDLTPTGSEEGEIVDLTLRTVRDGTLSIEASTHSNVADDFTDNNSDRKDVLVGTPVARPELSVSLVGIPEFAEEDTPVPVSVVLQNSGAGQASGSVLELTVSEGLEFSTVPSVCNSVAGDLVCDYGQLEPGSARNLTIMVLSTDAGLYSVSAVVTASNADEVEAVASLEIQQPAEPVDGGGDSGGDSGGSAGGETGADTSGGNVIEVPVDGLGETGGDSDGSTDSGTTDAGVAVPQSSSSGAFGPLTMLVLMVSGFAQCRRRAKA